MLLAKLDKIAYFDISCYDSYRWKLNTASYEILLMGKKVKIDLGNMDYKTWREELQEDADTLELLILMMKDITPEHDSKLQTLIELLDEKMTHSINEGNKKVLIFC